MQLNLERRLSPLGRMLLLTDSAHTLHALDFEDFEDRFRKLVAQHYPAAQLHEGPASAQLCAALDAYFDGDLGALDRVPVATCGSPFQRRVWTALRRIPAGETTSYGALAKQLNAPGASRAVGRANATNPIALVVPCHRVVGNRGTLTGYAGGLERKRWLLAHEARMSC